mmetsp:Transcript_7403/g.12718  ORF Transcript_7403/g.12718 Transcript_7403/m.12718 type:complete len:163 (+) Transcript_7403:89-577(+)
MNRPRSSILNRPKKEASMFNVENAAREHAEEQRKLQLMAEKQRQFEEAALKRLFPSPQDKVVLQEQERTEIDRHLEVRQSLRTLEKHEDGRIAENLTKIVQTQEDLERQKVDARRDYERRVTEENLQLIEYRRQLKQQQKQQELEAERKNLTRPEPWGRSLK